jgi:hypothetical protein
MLAVAAATGVNALYYRFGKSENFPRIDKTQSDKGMANESDKNEGFLRAAKDITAGSVGGIAQVLTGQPFDIVKVDTLPQRPFFLMCGS